MKVVIVRVIKDADGETTISAEDQDAAQAAKAVREAQKELKET